MPTETSKFELSVLTLVSPVSSVGITDNKSMYVTPTMILYEDMKPIEHVLHHPICVLSHLMCACKHCNVKLSLYYWTHWSCWWIYHFKKRRIHEIFDMIRPRHQGRLKNQIWVKKLSVGALHGHMRKTPTFVTRSEHLRIYCHVIVTHQRPTVEQSAR